MSSPKPMYDAHYFNSIKHDLPLSRKTTMTCFHLHQEGAANYEERGSQLRIGVCHHEDQSPKVELGYPKQIFYTTVLGQP